MYTRKMETPFEQLTGEVSMRVRDPHGYKPATIIQTDHAWQVAVKFHFDGPMAPFLGGVCPVKVYAESIGPGQEILVGCQVVALSEAPPLPQKREYATVITVPAGLLLPGAYLLVALVTYEHGGVPLEIAGTVAGPIIQIYEGLPA